jgi:hypothetical protein
MASKLFVGDLPHSTTDALLNEFLTDAGFPVASAVVIRGPAQNLSAACR